VSRLTPDAEELVRTARAALRPSVADRDRVFQRLLQRVPPGTESDGNAAKRTGPAMGRATLAKVTGVVVGLIAAGAAAFFTLRQDPSANAIAPGPAIPVLTPPRDAPHPVSSSPTLVPPADTAATVADTAPPPARSLSTNEGASAAPRTRSARPAGERSSAPDTLSAEVALIARASADLHAARPAAALEVLDEHRRRFPNGVLVQERAAARIRALCALGRVKEAKIELARLTRTNPDSPHTARAARECASTPLENK
jgi:hypothetical protein